MNKIIVISILIIMSLSSHAADNTKIVYQITEIHKNADLNIKLIHEYKYNGNLWGETEEVLKLFKPTKGKNTIFVFMASFEGIGYEDERDIFHDVMILKVDKNNIILDGLHYTLEWAEPPKNCALYRVTKTGATLKKGLAIKDLGLKSFGDECSISPIGKIDNIYRFKEIF